MATKCLHLKFHFADWITINGMLKYNKHELRYFFYNFHHMIYVANTFVECLYKFFFLIILWINKYALIIRNFFFLNINFISICWSLKFQLEFLIETPLFFNGTHAWYMTEGTLRQFLVESFIIFQASGSFIYSIVLWGACGERLPISIEHWWNQPTSINIFHL